MYKAKRSNTQDECRTRFVKEFIFITLYCTMYIVLILLYFLISNRHYSEVVLDLEVVVFVLCCSPHACR